MSHFDYPPGTPTGVVPSLYVVPESDWAHVIGQLFKAINGDGGGTWAPGSFITVGGSGFQLTGTGHSLAASARLNVESTGEVRLKNGALLRADGSAGDIRLEVLSNIATLTAETGSVVKVNSGAALDVYGGLTFKQTGGPGLATWESGTSAVWASGATLTLASGATANLTGATLVRGTMTLKASGGPGSFVVESGTTVTLGGSTTVQPTASEVWQEGATINGVVTRAGIEIRSGTSARTAHRAAFSLPNANADCTVAYGRYNVPLIVTASRVYTVRHTGTVPREGERIRFNRTGIGTPSETFGLAVSREDGTVIFKFGADRQGFCEIEFDGTNWILIAGYQTVSTQSGYYDDVW